MECERERERKCGRYRMCVLERDNKYKREIVNKRQCVY